MNQQELVWVRLPFSDLEGSKVRPAVVISNNQYNKRSEDVMLCAITSKQGVKQCGVSIDSSNLSSGNLAMKSFIRADKIMSVKKALIIKQFGKLDSQTFDILISEIVKILQR